jgi:hypothetical protein
VECLSLAYLVVSLVHLNQPENERLFVKGDVFGDRAFEHFFQLILALLI